MRKFSLLILALTVGFVALADNPTTPPPPPTSGIPVPINPDDPFNPRPLNIYRSSDIEAGYYDSVLTVVFNADLGNADIMVTNTTTGECWCGSVSGMGVATIVLSGDEGYYQINIYTGAGAYYGEFII